MLEVFEKLVKELTPEHGIIACLSVLVTMFVRGVWGLVVGTRAVKTPPPMTGLGARLLSLLRDSDDEEWSLSYSGYNRPTVHRGTVCVNPEDLLFWVNGSIVDSLLNKQDKKLLKPEVNRLYKLLKEKMELQVYKNHIAALDEQLGAC